MNNKPPMLSPGQLLAAVLVLTAVGLLLANLAWPVLRLSILWWVTR